MADLSVFNAQRTHLLEKWSCIAALGHEVHLWTFGRSRRYFNLDGINIRQVPHIFVRGLKGISYQCVLLASLLRHSLKIKPNIIYSRSSVSLDFAPLICSMLLNVPLIIEIPGPISEEASFYGIYQTKLRIINWLMRLKLHKASQILTVTEPIKSGLQRDYFVNPEKIHVIHNGANTALFKPIDQSIARQSLGLERQKEYVGFVGNMLAWQGLDVLVTASVKVLKVCPNISFLIVGEGVMKSKLQDQVSTLGVTGNFIFTGSVPYREVPFYVNSCDLMVLPLITKRSYDSGYSPLKLYEYMACGKPVIASRLLGMEVLEKQCAGILVESNNANALADGILSALKDPVSLEKMGIRGRRVAVEEFDWKIVAKKTERLIQNVVQVRNQ